MSVSVTRWDPESRAGAVAVRVKKRRDYAAMRAMADTIQEWAEYTEMDGELDNVETSPITGTYDWRAYLREEADYARRREAASQAQGKKVARSPPPAPPGFYA